ncbi:MAG: alpha/beta hydrolase [Bacteroidetes bacterium]|nr:alpha/beta hydrolase [Bacteroidota bacterium]
MISISTGDKTFLTREKGKGNGEAVILLHGFPSSSRMWLPFQSFLAEKGLYSLAPDQRGYSPGACPVRIEDYLLKHLAEDVICLADERGLDCFHLVGHDWGSIVSSAVAARYPKRLLSLTLLSVPHPGALSTSLQFDPVQQEASKYMEFFQNPHLPEELLSKDDFARFRQMWNSRTVEEVTSYLSVLSRKGALTAALNWYRANYSSLISGKLLLDKISIPTLFIWGKNDMAITESAASLNKTYFSGYYKEVFLDKGHGLIEEDFPSVSTLIYEHFSIQI